ncbi:MAG: hypothetical protein EOO75_11575 [Myxococcales bacterium]|nr:MAG: hypothetical protein EOO75_11575 [Myxococcales bacterium]
MREATPTARRREPAWRLLREAAGSPSEARAKLRRLAGVLAGYGRGERVAATLGRLHERGHIERIPGRVQLVVGAVDMLRFWISPAAADYYERQGISYAFHQLLRLADEPASLADPVGFFSTRDGIIGHLMQVVHANPVYDLQLLDAFDDGLDALEEQLDRMLAGEHPRSRAIAAIVEEADYHERLRAFVRAWRRDPGIAPLLRSNVADRPELAPVERTFGTLTAAVRYFCRLPDTPARAAWHLLRVSAFPAELAEPRESR